MVEKPSKLQPALIGGVVLGLLSSIPFISLGNLCCCLWVLLGGALASKLLINNSPVLPVTNGDGATVGAIAGAFGSLVNLVVGVPITLFMGSGAMFGVLEKLSEIGGNPDFQEQMRRTMEEAQRQSAGQRLGGALLGWLIGAVVTIAFATLGGLLGTMLFEKRKGQPMPPAGYPPPGAPGEGPPPTY